METTEILCANCGQAIDKIEGETITLGKATYCEDCAENLVECCDCNCVVNTDDAYTNDDGESYCEDCYNEKYTRCDHCSEEVAIEDAKEAKGNYYCEDCFNDKFIVCENCGNTFSRERSYSSDGGEDYCNDCYWDIYTRCEHCDCELLRDDAQCVNGCDYCDSCVPSPVNWEEKEFHPLLTTKEIQSERCFGVELETSSCPDHSDIQDETIFGCKDDGSINGKEFISPILYGDEGLEAIREFCKVANKQGFEVDKTCGFHLHLDMGNESTEFIKRIAYAYLLTECVWQSFVHESRRANHYCRSIEWNTDRLHNTEDNYDLRELADRYFWLNLCSLTSHHTIEIRLHSSTLDSDKVCNWVKAHARFVDFVKTLTYSELDALFNGSASDRFFALAGIIGDELAEFYRKRALKFGTTYQPLKKVA